MGINYKMGEQVFPEPVVGALIFNKENKLFLMKSHKFCNMYIVPGGHIELGETMEEALKREINEETGMDIYDLEFISFQEFIYDNVFWKKRHFIMLDFSCKTDSEEVKLNDEAQEYLWVSLKDALMLKIEPYTKKLIQDYITKKGIKI